MANTRSAAGSSSKLIDLRRSARSAPAAAGASSKAAQSSSKQKPTNGTRPTQQPTSSNGHDLWSVDRLLAYDARSGCFLVRWEADATTKQPFADNWEPQANANAGAQTEFWGDFEAVQARYAGNRTAYPAPPRPLRSVPALPPLAPVAFAERVAFAQDTHGGAAAADDDDVDNGDVDSDAEYEIFVTCVTCGKSCFETVLHRCQDLASVHGVHTEVYTCVECPVREYAHGREPDAPVDAWDMQREPRFGLLSCAGCIAAQRQVSGL